MNVFQAAIRCNCTPVTIKRKIRELFPFIEDPNSTILTPYQIKEIEKNIRVYNDKKYTVYRLTRLTGHAPKTIKKWVCIYFPYKKDDKTILLNEKEKEYLFNNIEIGMKFNPKTLDNVKKYISVQDLIIEAGISPGTIVKNHKVKNSQQYKEIKKMINIERDDKEKLKKVKRFIKYAKEVINNFDKIKMEKIFYDDHYVVKIFFADNIRKDLYINSEGIFKTEYHNLQKDKKIYNNKYKEWVTYKITCKHPLDFTEKNKKAEYLR